MKLRHTMTFTLLAAAFTGYGAMALADGDEGYFRAPWGSKARPGVAPATNPAYREECGSCHFAYQPGLLPARSWEKLMATLDDHFGENAELPEPDRIAIRNYLLDNAAGRSDYRVSNKLLRGLRGAPVRISELPYFRHEHREIPPRLVTGNPKVRSLSNCEACHTRAGEGSFREREISIPGFGRYDD